MATPTLSASLNKTSFAPGDVMMLTISYADADTDAGTVSVVVTDAAGHASTPVVLPYSINDPQTLTVTDPERTWVKVSDNGSVAVYRCTA